MPAAAIPRRKFTKELDLHVLKEVQAVGANIAERGLTVVLFADVNRNLNCTSLFPWKMDGKHCPDRFKLLLAQWRSADRERAKRSGRGEEYGE